MLILFKNLKNYFFVISLLKGLKLIKINYIKTLYNLNFAIFKNQSLYSMDYLTEICKKRYGFIINFIDKPAGYVLYDYIDDEIVKETVLTIMSLGVLKEYRGLGLGRTLLETVLELFPKEGICLRVVANNIPAKKLYESEGFIILKHLPKYFKFVNGEEDGDLMVN